MFTLFPVEKNGKKNTKKIEHNTNYDVALVDPKEGKYSEDQGFSALDHSMVEKLPARLLTFDSQTMVCAYHFRVSGATATIQTDQPQILSRSSANT